MQSNSASSHKLPAPVPNHPTAAPTATEDNTPSPFTASAAAHPPPLSAMPWPSLVPHKRNVVAPTVLPLRTTTTTSSDLPVEEHGVREEKSTPSALPKQGSVDEAMPWWRRRGLMLRRQRRQKQRPPPPPPLGARLPGDSSPAEAEVQVEEAEPQDEEEDEEEYLELETLVLNHVKAQNQQRFEKPMHRSSCFQLLDASGLTRAIHQDYTDVLLDPHHYTHHDAPLAQGTAPREPVDRLQVGQANHFEAALHLVHEFIHIHATVQRFALAQSLLQSVWDAIEDYVYPRISDYYLETLMPSLTPAEAASVVTFLDAFQSPVAALKHPTVQLSPRWQTDTDRLIRHYLERGVQQEVRALIQQSIALRSPDDLRQNAEGHIVTGHPEQILFMVETQLQVARDNLPTAYHGAVLVVCNQEISQAVSHLMYHVGSNWHILMISQLCAAINDASRLSELLGDLNEELLQSEDHRATGDQVVRELAEMSLHCTTFLCERIMLDVREPEPILNNVGSVAWEQDETGTIVARTLATLSDYFGDLEGWIVSNYFFPKVLKFCFELTLETYIQSFFANTKTSEVHNPQAISKIMDEDYLKLIDFFNGPLFVQYQGTAGFYTEQQMNARLHILKSLSRLINPSVETDELYHDVLAVMREFRCGATGAPIVFHCAGLRKRQSSSQTVEWVRLIAQAENTLRSAQALPAESADDSPDGAETTPAASSTPSHTTHATDGAVPHVYNLPDLRDSTKLRRVRLNKEDLHRRVSAKSLATAEAVSEMLHKKTTPLPRWMTTMPQLNPPTIPANFRGWNLNLPAGVNPFKSKNPTATS